MTEVERGILQKVAERDIVEEGKAGSGKKLSCHVMYVHAETFSRMFSGGGEESSSISVSVWWERSHLMPRLFLECSRGEPRNFKACSAERIGACAKHADENVMDGKFLKMGLPKTRTLR